MILLSVVRADAASVNPLAAIEAPLLITIVAAVAVLAVIALDLRKLRVASQLTVAHGVVGASFAATVLTLTLLMASATALSPAVANEEVTPPFVTTQLPTL